MPASFGSSIGSSGASAGGGGGFGNYAQLVMQILPSLMGGQQQATAAPAVDNSGLLGPPIGQGLPRFKAASNAQIGGVDAAITPPASETLPDKSPANPFIGFFDKLDNNLQSPSKQIGLGLLGQQDPNLALAGIIAMGLLGGADDSTTNK